jgi:hypothetical protein
LGKLKLENMRLFMVDVFTKCYTSGWTRIGDVIFVNASASPVATEFYGIVPLDGTGVTYRIQDGGGISTPTIKPDPSEYENLNNFHRYTWNVQNRPDVDELIFTFIMPTGEEMLLSTAEVIERFGAEFAEELIAEVELRLDDTLLARGPITATAILKLVHYAYRIFVGVRQVSRVVQRSDIGINPGFSIQSRTVFGDADMSRLSDRVFNEAFRHIYAPDSIESIWEADEDSVEDVLQELAHQRERLEAWGITRELAINYFELLRCRDIALEFSNTLQSRGVPHQFATFIFGPWDVVTYQPTIVRSITGGIFYPSVVISENGWHVGIYVKGMIFCNVHILGLPVRFWLADFISLGNIRMPLGTVELNDYPRDASCMHTTYFFDPFNPPTPN